MPDKVTITKSKLDSLAEVIGSKSNQNIPLTIEGMEDAVLSIITPIGTKLITENGTYDVTNYANTKINVPEAFVITPMYAYNSDDGPSWTIDKTYDEVDAAYSVGKTIVIDAKIPNIDYYQYCTATFFMDQFSSSRSYTIMIGWYDGNDNLYHEWYYDAYSDNKTWNLRFQNEYEYPKYLIEKTITTNGIYDPTKNLSGDGYSKVTVNVPPTTLQSLTVTPSTEQQVFNASSQMSDTALFTGGYSIGASSSFPIELAIGTNYWLVLTRYNKGTGWTDSQINKVYDPVLWTATENYSYPFSNELYMRVRYNGAINNATSSYRYWLAVYPIASSTAYAPVTVEPIPSEYTVPTLQAKTNINPTTSSQTITADSGYDGLSSVQINAMPSGTTGTPVATKGTVSNNSITVTPKVTNTTGYITGGTKTGTPVTVSASELVSGTYSITENNTYDVTNIANVVVNVPTGNIIQDANGYLVLDENGSSSSLNKSMNDPIRFFDYDGTLIASYDSVPSSPPIVPTHTGLTNGTWNYTLAQVATQFNAMGTCDVGANYDTLSGATEIDIELQDTRLHPYLSLAINGTVTIDWGDNSTSTASGTSLMSRKNDIHHEYTTAGNYTIKIIKTNGTGYSLYCTDAYSLLNKNSSVINANRVYSNCIQSVRIGKDCTIGAYAFNTCYSLRSVSIPSGVTRIGTYAFNSCYSLTSVSIPISVTSIDSYAFRTCCSLTSVSIPTSVTNISSYVFSHCYLLTSVSIPTSVTSGDTSMFSNCHSLISASIPSKITTISIDMFSYCYSLASVFISSKITTISSYAFAGCYGIAEYHFESITPPTLANTNAFASIQSDCKMYVPYSADHSILTAYQTAENWSTYASYMVEESE